MCRLGMTACLPQHMNNITCLDKQKTLTPKYNVACHNSKSLLITHFATITSIGEMKIFTYFVAGRYA